MDKPEVLPRGKWVLEVGQDGITLVISSRFIHEERIYLVLTLKVVSVKLVVVVGRLFMFFF